MNSELLSNVELIEKDERNNNCNNTKQKFEQDVLETPRIDQFKHENNPFASSFKDEVLKAEFSRLNSVVQCANITGTIDSPLPTVFVQPNELSILPLPLSSSNNYTSTTQGMSSPSSSSLSTNSTSSSPNNEPYSSYVRQLSQTSLSVSLNSNTAPKKSILLRTFSQNDGALDDTKSTLNSEHKNGHAILLNRTNSSSNNQIQQTDHSHQQEQQQQQQHQQNNIFKFLNMHHNKAEENDLDSIKNKHHLDENLDIETESKYTKLSESFLTETNSISSQSNDTPSPFSETTKGAKNNDSKLVKKKRSIASTSETRRQQIRDSNREAARRCRERKRTYIETLESNIRNLEKSQKDLLFENENLRKILNEHLKTCNINLNNGQIMNGHANIANNSQLNNILKRFHETTSSKNENLVSNIPVYLAAELTDATKTTTSNLRGTNSKTALISSANASNAVLNVNNNSLICKNNLLKDLIETNNLNLITKTNTTMTSLFSQSNELACLTNQQILEKFLEKISKNLHQNTFNFNNNFNNSFNATNTSPNDKNIQHIESILPSNIN